MQEQLLAPLNDEARRAPEESVVASEGHLDLGAVFGARFTDFRGGPCTTLRQQKQAASSKMAAKTIKRKEA